MIATCVLNRGEALGVAVRGLFYTDRTTFDVKIGSEYAVLGMGIYNDAMVVLVMDETGKPNWLPIGLFTFNGQTLPSGWHFRILNASAASGVSSGPGWTARWGYPQLVEDDSHVDGLIERNADAMAIFRREFHKGVRE